MFCNALTENERVYQMLIKASMLIVFFAVMVSVGIYFRKHTGDVDSFLHGGRSVGPWLSAFAYGTTYFSAVVFVGYAGQFGWRFGISATWIGLGNAIIGSMMTWIVLGNRTRLMTRHIGSATMPDFFGIRYGSDALKIAASMVVFIFLIPYTASLYNGLSRLFAMAFNVDFTVCIVLMAVLTGVYVIAGGYVATAVNDVIQGVIMIIGIIAIIAAVLGSNGGFLNSLALLAKVEGGAIPGVYASFFGPDPVGLLGVFVLTSLGTWGLPQMVQKFYAVKSESAVFQGTVISTVFAIIISGGCYFLGGFGRLFLSPEQQLAVGFDAIIPTMMMGFSDTLIGLTVLLVLSASMSTLSSLVMTSASTLTLDVLKGHIIKEMDGKKQLTVIRILITVFVAISASIAAIQYKQNITYIAQLMGISWGALAGSFLAPFLYGLFWKRTSRIAVWVNLIFSTAFMTANMLFRSSFPALLQSPINAGAFAMILGMIIVPLISILTPAPDKKIVEHCFKAYDVRAK